MIKDAEKKYVQIGIIAVMLVLGSLASVMYAMAYTQKREVIYTNTITIGAKEVKFRGFYLSAPAGLFEVKLKVSNGTIKWTPHSAVMFDDTLGWFPKRITQDTFGKIQRWVCETGNETVKWSANPENLDMVWYINFYNEDNYKKNCKSKLPKYGKPRTITTGYKQKLYLNQTQPKQKNMTSSGFNPFFYVLFYSKKLNASSEGSLQ